MPSHEGIGQAQLATERPDLVLEQLTQRLDQLQLHEVRQATDIVVALDHMGLAA